MVTPGGGRTILRDPRYAARFWQNGIGGTQRGVPSIPQRALPKRKDFFFINFVVSSDATSLLSGGLRKYEDSDTGISFLVKSFSQPGIQLETEKINQYNKWRVNYKKVAYQPINVVFTESYDERFYCFIQDYLRIHTNEFNHETKRAWNVANNNSDIYASEFSTANIDFGFAYNTRNFFECIEVYSFNLGRFTKYSLVNPKITDISFDDFDYESDAPHRPRLTIEYETVIRSDDDINNRIDRNLANKASLTDHGMDQTLGNDGQPFRPTFASGTEGDPMGEGCLTVEPVREFTIPEQFGPFLPPNFRPNNVAPTNFSVWTANRAASLDPNPSKRGSLGGLGLTDFVGEITDGVNTVVDTVVSPALNVAQEVQESIGEVTQTVAILGDAATDVIRVAGIFAPISAIQPALDRVNTTVVDINRALNVPYNVLNDVRTAAGSVTGSVGALNNIVAAVENTAQIPNRILNSVETNVRNLETASRNVADLFPQGDSAHGGPQSGVNRPWDNPDTPENEAAQ